MRRDDGAGLAVLERLKARRMDTATLLEHSGEGAGLLETWADYQRVILIDAVRCGAPPGTVHRLEVGERPLPRDVLPGSSHLFGVAEAIELARQLGRLPKTFTLYGIEGADFNYGEGLSAAVAKAASTVSDAIEEELSGNDDD